MNDRRPHLPRRAGPAERFLTGVFGFVFGGIGLTVIAFLWGSPSNEFGSPPLVFRVFGSFIALAFVAFGGVALFGGLTAGDSTSSLGSMQSGQAQSVDDESEPAGNMNYTCPRCSAPLSNKADVSPHGDVKCSFCNGWFNVHGK